MEYKIGGSSWVTLAKELEILIQIYFILITPRARADVKIIIGSNPQALNLEWLLLHLNYPNMSWLITRRGITLQKNATISRDLMVWNNTHQGILSGLFEQGLGDNDPELLSSQQPRGAYMN
jgi:hypothetical protein